MNKYESSRNKVTKCYKNLIWNILQETYSEFYQTSTPEFRPFTIFAKKFHLRGLTGFWYIFDYSKRTNASSPKSPDTLRKNLHLFHFEFWGMCEVFITFFMRLRTGINKYGPKYLRFIGSGDKEVIPFICNYTVKLTLTFFRVIKVLFLYVCLAEASSYMFGWILNIASYDITKDSMKSRMAFNETFESSQKSICSN